MPSGPDDYQKWLGVCRRYSRRAGEAEDLLHNALAAALTAGRRDLSDPGNAAWFAGVIRNQAAMDARTAGRRRKREALHSPAPDAPVDTPPDEVELWLAAVNKLPRASRSVAVLALHGLNRAEIAAVLGITDVALRQRLTALRKAWDTLDPRSRPEGPPSRRSTIRTRLELGLLRRSLLQILRHEGDLGTHDPDGHLLVLTRKDSRNRVPRQQ